MSKLLLFLGAGASAPRGIPTSRAFIDVFDGIAEDKGFDLWGEIKASLGAVYGEKRVDLELAFSVLREVRYLGRGDASELSPLVAVLQHMGKVSTDLADWVEEAGALLESFKETIRSRCEDYEHESARELYRRLFNSVPSQQFTIPGGSVALDRGPSGFGSIPYCDAYTTNYDLSFKNSCGQADVPYNDGFRREGGEFVLDPSMIRDTGGFRIFHLHGALNEWNTETGVIQSSVPPDLKVGERTYGGIEFHGEAQMYPVLEKDVFGSPYNLIYSELQRSLHDLPIWAFVGFSFHDRAIVSMVREALRRRRHRVKVILCNPTSARGIRQRVFEDRGSVAVVSEPFGSQAFDKAFREALTH